MTDAMSRSQQERLARLLGAEPLPAAALSARLPQDVPADWRILAAHLALNVRARNVRTRAEQQSMLLGLSGGQGAGKSTLARALVLALSELGLRAACLSLDDVYLTRAERAELGRTVHPLLATRGVPGTHDLSLLQQVLAARDQARFKMPVFNKAIDDRQPESQWPTIVGPHDVLVLEGWCLGAVPQAPEQLQAPVNELERIEDETGVYREYVNDALRIGYEPIWQQLHDWLFLAVPNLDAVRRWRTQQEQAIAPSKRMSAARIRRFVDHYERLTLWLLQTAPEHASWCLALDPDHRLHVPASGSGLPG